MNEISFEDYVKWRDSYQRTSAESATGYLRLLQDLYRDPFLEGDASAGANRAFARLRKQQLTALFADAPESEDAFYNEPSYLFQSYILRSVIHAPILEYLPNEAREAVKDVPIGVLPIRSVNAGVMPSPRGEPIIIVDSGLFMMISFFTESNNIGYTVIKDQEESDRYISSRYRFIVNYYERKGGLSFPDPQVEHQLGMKNAIMMMCQNICCETFVVCHEIAHILLGHVSKDDESQLSMAPAGIGANDARTQPSVFTHSQIQEFQADLLGYDLYREIVPKHPLLSAFSMNDFFLTECFMVFHLMHVVESNSKKFTGVTTHPTAEQRLNALLKLMYSRFKEAGRSDEELKQDSLLRNIYKHTVILSNMPTPQEAT